MLFQQVTHPTARMGELSRMCIGSLVFVHTWIESKLPKILCILRNKKTNIEYFYCKEKDKKQNSLLHLLGTEKCNSQMKTSKEQHNIPSSPRCVFIHWYSTNYKTVKAKIKSIIK